MTDNLLSLSADELKEFMADKFPEMVPEQAKPAAPTKRKVVIALLAYDSKLYCRTMISILDGLMHCAKTDTQCVVMLREGDSMIARGRSFLASMFLDDPGLQDATDLVFIDTDLEWSNGELARLIDAPVDVIGGAYPYKDDMGNFPLRWPATGLYEENGLWEVMAVTPGFLRVTRKALTALAREMPWLAYTDRGSEKGRKFWMFFDNLHRPNGIWDEGYVFCERLRACGYKIYLDPDMKFNHIGHKKFSHGSVRDWLMKKAETLTQLEHEFPHIPPLKLLSKAMGENVDLAAEPQVSAEEVAKQKAALAAMTPEQRQDAYATGMERIPLDETDRHPSDPFAARIVAAYAGAHAAQHGAEKYDRTIGGGRGRPADAGVSEGLADRQPDQGVDQAARRQPRRKVRSRANGSASGDIPAGG